jgi:hypothetical protein
LFDAVVRKNEDKLIELAIDTAEEVAKMMIGQNDDEITTSYCLLSKKFQDEFDYSLSILLCKLRHNITHPESPLELKIRR